MGRFDPRTYSVSILDMLKYDAIQDADGVIIKDLGYCLQMLVPMKNNKGHDTYEVYLRDNGTIEKVVGHSTNSGFTGTKYF